MTIAFLTPEYPHENTGTSGGLGTSIKNLSYELIAKGVHVIVVVVGQKKSQVFSDNGISIHSLKQKKYPALGFFLYRKSIEKYLNNLISLFNIDLVEAPDWTGLTAFMNLKAPIVLRFHGSDAYFCKLEGRKQKRKNYLYEKLALKGANAFVSVSKFNAEQTSKIFNLKTSIAVIPNGIDTDIFKPTGKKPDRNVILYFGSIIRKKGVLELAEIFNLVVEHHPDAKLIFVGPDVIDIFTGTSTKTLLESTFTKKANAQVIWISKLRYEQVQQKLALAEVVVLPSLAEALPMTWLEAMAMEKPLVTSNIGWAKEVMLNGVTGFTEDPKDHKAYAEKILYLLDNPCEAAEMGKAARDRVKKKFSTQVVVKRNLAFYKKVVENEKI
ncbi:glycosyltransferase family 4 protein [Salegentibacter sp. BDJ18]|uniref:glycosyltransferase family 4 protein n=1 Tax=Salegentibacter sp. BDJ18 TaxID=2816376 RepID=UPI001AAF3E1F|nr:glycosyltransferase family 4 protein [Salegentibacter sp. BDJ18]MBO2544290.1 glycosyltransferase family 4 protein [Salegentibacter sp. BDJ18]